MILLKISNASELVAAKLGDLVERLTPEFVDSSTVEDLVIKRMIANLSKEGIKGEISGLKGIDIEGDNITLNKGFKVRNHNTF